ncbi:C4-dicarboxylate transport sensor protein dctB (EC 2.7.3.-) (plasmid) [Mycetohabitans rhizoxinica HKI 454]|uniref:C4-dicarboxylate transport sensor protein DctB n=1 Tax=Mycetohabitans rhizoxinica (strain DSM 19002 / CIP 109453 / HKI 454) TaxID=882378 RepID=E5AV90_MYCRK|nr:ATP-binding protein [Mycetohabitans rhizoxinica]MCG1048297.1 sensor histidine kinase [Mycetohabitans sp. B6]CBW77014.1 C4-dicarboxylate transport sensor protein dctB (EC 2.7.3.-) [Mycetohabitans rhizoxinica HKI 454]
MLRRTAVLLVLAAVIIASCVAAWSSARTHAIDRLREASAARAARTSATLQAALDRYEPLPYLLSTHPLVQDALRQPNGEAVARANRYLEEIAQRSKASQAYLITGDGLCVAASNWREPDSFVGMRYVFRPYFVAAVAGREDHFFGIGTRSHQAGYYISQPVSYNGTQIGVVVIKIDLSWFPPQDRSEPLFVTDANGIVILSSIPSWRYHTTRPLSNQASAWIRDTEQYSDEPLKPLPLTKVRTRAAGAELVRFGSGPPAPLYLQTEQPLSELGWQLTVLSPLDDVDARARAMTVATGLALLIAALLGFYWRLRRAKLREMEYGRRMLQSAYAELNQRVAERTADLSAANEQLTREVSERTRAEAELRAAQDELVQASKLAALGQMAAGITHELNQPLAALRTFSDNTRVLIERNALDAARENLQAIATLIDRMGRITNQLKLFVSKRRPRDAHAIVAQALRNALVMLRDKLAGIDVRVVSVHAGGKRAPFDLNALNTSPAVRCDDLRVEQALINLIGNAADALASHPTARIIIEVDTRPDVVAIAVIDNGPGIAADLLPRLFEPFFTTKEMGQGLGLGLAIAASIVRDAGGTLSVATARDKDRDATARGACFVMTLPRAYARSSQDAPA